MQQNIEIKAKINDLNDFLNQVKSFCKSDGRILKQCDTFYKIEKGRLKLRQFEVGDSELIFYERPNIEGPKLSQYKKTLIPANNSDQLNDILSLSLGVIGTVKKIRYLFILDQTRIHVDNVEGLGAFMELEVVLKPNQTPLDGEYIARDLMKLLKIEDKNLLSEAYIDSIIKNKNP